MRYLLSVMLSICRKWWHRVEGIMEELFFLKIPFHIIFRISTFTWGKLKFSVERKARSSGLEEVFLVIFPPPSSSSVANCVSLLPHAHTYSQTPFALFERLLMLSFKPITRLVSRGHFIFKLPRSGSQLKGPPVRAFAPKLWWQIALNY